MKPIVDRTIIYRYMCVVTRSERLACGVSGSVSGYWTSRNASNPLAGLAEQRVNARASVTSGPETRFFLCWVRPFGTTMLRLMLNRQSRLAIRSITLSAADLCGLTIRSALEAHEVIGWRTW